MALPLARPGVTVAMILAFIFSWNNFIFGVVLAGRTTRTLPVAVIGSDAVRRGWRIRPRKVRLRVGRPLHYPTVESCSPALASAVTERIWACVSLQWEWLGGLPPRHD